MGRRPPDIFAKPRLTANQLRHVSERRFDDALCLFKSGDRARFNGAMYMAGFVVECLLKALLLDRHPNLQTKVDPGKLSASDRKIYGLLFSHDLELMLDALPEIVAKLEDLKDSYGNSVWQRFIGICGEWTVFARYSTNVAESRTAEGFLDTIREVKKWLKEL